MGSTSSKASAEKIVHVNEKANYLSSDGRRSANNDVQDLTKHLKDVCNLSGSADPLTFTNYAAWEKELLDDPKNRLALHALHNVDVTTVIKNRSAVIDDRNVFSDKIELEGSPVTNQKSSGRCWIFASTNVFRVGIQQKYNISDLQLSQSYLFFYDKLEKSNYFLDQIIDTADEPLDSRLIQTLLTEPISDGGQWDMIVNLVNKYGVVPQSAYPDSYNAENSRNVNYFIVNKLREYALVLRDLKSDTSVNETTLNSVKEKFVHEIYNVLILALGVPPKPNETITWEYYDKDNKFHSQSTSPLDFYKSVVKYNANEYFSLIHDPRHDYKSLFTVDRLNNVTGGKPIEYVNADIDVLKQAAIKSIKNSEPVFFGSDVSKFFDRDAGLMDINVWDYEAAFNTSMGLTKRQRLQTASSAMNHAMVLTGVHIVDGKPTKWRVENSWGDSVGHKGYYVMSDKWFDEYVFQVVTSAKYTDKEYVNIWKSKKYSVLPRWDPLGSLA